ncbi:alpha-ketoglutarate-dependent dioxygenase AlkB [Dyella psychrodurans]|uniref:Alpha-ketoglutarate-dependent dioxygenase AlkB n=2 Tax=Dyella psychrodurans TaxID=1927960 RepID=A0A370X5B2_9GAMM|nr:alpha-ketoglutarate-dependent dioxygenase AlkB [Dyella psychrodurans]
MADPGDATWERLPLPGADVRCAWSWLPREDADALFENLSQEIPWERHRLRMFGRELDAPRLSCWIGDPDAVYVYSRTRFEPRPWTPSLHALRERVERSCGARFNSVLANLYRDGADSMGWHSDDEPELGSQPIIASLSLGATRRFRLRRRLPRGIRATPADTLDVQLAHGSLLCMSGATQHLYQHDLPRSAAVTKPRINLTFRLIHVPAERQP